VSNYSVLLYKNTQNPDGIPGDWPATVVLLPDDVHEVDPPHQIMTDTEYNEYINNPVLIAQKNAWQNSKQGIFHPIAKIQIENVTCQFPLDHPAYQMFNYRPSTNENSAKIRVIENMPILVKIRIRDLSDSYTIPVNDGFALPILGEGMPTQLLYVDFVNGEATVNLSFPSTGVFEITQQDLNRELPPDSNFLFDGIKIYVLKVP
jgi:hypothetical protein